jgi:iron complex outermembrane recepter protein
MGHRLARGAGCAAAMAIVASMVSLAAPVRAQQQQPQQEEAAQLGRIAVVGSRIRRVDVEGPQPVIVISAQDIENSGFATVQEVLDSLPQNTGGGFDQSFVFGFTPSASAVDIRGFGVGRVLILLDGRRLPIFPFASNGTDNFVDLNSIPSAAIERIEVLPAGASAIYGSDAISGVINIVLRKDVEGTQVNLRYGDTMHGGGDTSRIQLYHGTNTARGSTSVIMEYFTMGRIMAGDRDYAANDVVLNALPAGAGPNGNGSIGAFSSFAPAGTLVDLATGDHLAGPNCTPNPNDDFVPPGILDTGGSGTTSDGYCRFNRSRYRELLPDFNHVSVMLNTERELSADTKFFARASFQQGQVRTQIEPMPLIYADGLPPIVGCDRATLGSDCDFYYDADPNDPRDGIANNPNDLSGGTYLLPGVYRRMLEWGPRQNDFDLSQWSALLGLNGTLGNRFDWELALGNYEIQVKDQNINYAREDLIREAINTGEWNVFDTATPDFVQATRTDPTARGESAIKTLDFDITGDLWQMRHGMAQFAAIFEYAEERFSDERDADLINNNTIGLGGTAGGGSRDRWAIGGELQLPLAEKLSMNLALRSDTYNDASDVGSATVPRLAIEYRPTVNLLVRGHWGQSFRAPDLQRLFGATTRAFDDLVDTPYCEANGGTRGSADPTPADGFNECQEAVISVPLEIGANTALKEEEGEDFGAGVVWQATERITVTADLFAANLKGLVRDPDQQFILDNSASFPDAVEHSAANVAPDNPGGLSLVRATAVNIGERRTKGVDLMLEYNMPTMRVGTFDVNFGATYTDELKEQLAPGESFDDLAEVPKWRANTRLDWSNDSALSVTLFSTWIDHYAQFNETAWQQHVSSYLTWNGQVRWQLTQNGELRVGVNNLTDRDPPHDFQDGNAGWPFYNQFYHDPYGRSWFSQYTQSF